MKPSQKLYDLPPTLVARKPFALGRKKYAVGDVLDWKADGLKERRVQQMWDQRWIGTPAELARDQGRWEAKKEAEKAAKKSSAPKPELTPEMIEAIEAEKPQPRRGRRRKPEAEAAPVTSEDFDL